MYYYYLMVLNEILDSVSGEYPPSGKTTITLLIVPDQEFKHQKR